MTTQAPAAEHGEPAALPSPEHVRSTFARLESADPERAVRYLYDLGLTSGYIRAQDIARNVCWTAPSAYGELEITINLSKPEKDPRAIAAQAAQPCDCVAPADSCALSIPQCDLCWENEGFAGTPQRPAKPGLRIAAIELGGEPWGLQFSPYAYFGEHCIALSRTHRPMRVDTASFVRLFDFVDRFPFYFVGSNADLPIVGGSILSHDHYQGGRHEFALMRAPVERAFAIAGCPEVDAGVVAWPASVVRLESRNRSQLLRAANRVHEVWRTWCDDTCGIVPATGSTPHNTLNPIARKLDGAYVLDLVLRNNRTTPQRPWGLFHPGEHLHHIKRENIGLIEIMGLAVLPPRLARELPQVQRALYGAALNGEAPCTLRARLERDPQAAAHAFWAAGVLERRRACLLEEARGVQDACRLQGARVGQTQGFLAGCELGDVLRGEVAGVFELVLEATGVFKRDAQGQAALDRFIAAL